ncbi:twin-arginine translocase TatA/TatE family subunit [Ferruginibacter yonginensis]|uniref:Twin-arginine translocase TatA/TatE family subunit n=1 Tax=Ferruginibacter yonginensis TaxID=1310416 RepID=A0ABV8QT50_9BACT
MVQHIFNNVLLLSMPGGSEWILIILVVLLMFGGKKIPELMRGVGKGMREFNDAKNNVKSEIEEGMREKDRQPMSTADEIRLQELKLQQLREEQALKNS